MKKEIISMKNVEIFSIATALLKNFENEDLASNLFPVKVGFYFQKNFNTIVALAQDIDENRSRIIRKYGHVANPEEPDNVIIDPEDVDIVNSELEDLFAITQDVTITYIPLDWFDNITLTNSQISAISFMILED